MYQNASTRNFGVKQLLSAVESWWTTSTGYSWARVSKRLHLKLRCKAVISGCGNLMIYFDGLYRIVPFFFNCANYSDLLSTNSIYSLSTNNIHLLPVNSIFYCPPTGSIDSLPTIETCCVCWQFGPTVHQLVDSLSTNSTDPVQHLCLYCPPKAFKRMWLYRYVVVEWPAKREDKL